MTDWSRRGALAALATLGTGALTATAGCLGREPPGWQRIDLRDDARLTEPAAASLSGVTTAADGAYAVGEDGTFLVRTPAGWADRSGALPDGVDDLTDVAASNNGRTVWLCGDRGTVLRCRVYQTRVMEYSTPGDRTDRWTAVGVDGLAGQERLLVTNGSGEVVTGQFGGGSVDWSTPTEPGGGSSITAGAFSSGGDAYVCDTNQGVYHESVPGDWHRIGIGAADTDFAALTPVGGSVTVAGDDGALFRQDSGSWHRSRVGDATLLAVQRNRFEGLASDAAGRIYANDEDGWRQSGHPVERRLTALTLGSARIPAIAVGTAGAVVEWR
ncbi:hypothetical protein [Haloarchaeobius amylolyticus]|uniref:hypothetical protein n=1 Tax=Haloarchaeobius amylolyticus TaxID=1198296 RepID=UPI00226E4B62|nr:hypothetical protein [Haloarchaeobius amylolyticus]